MKVIIERPTESTFNRLRVGQVFEHHGNIYIKSGDERVTSIYKNVGHMNQGFLQDFPSDMVVQRVTEITFKLGNVS